jgi:hypothetical protein
MCRQLFTRFTKHAKVYLKTLPNIEESLKLKDPFTDHMLHLTAFEQKLFHALC